MGSPRSTKLLGIVRRLLAAAGLLFGLVTLVFATVRLVPGDPVDHLLGDQATDAERQSLRRAMGLDGSLPQQFGRMLGEIADGSLGRSYAVAGREVPVSTLIADRLPSTLALAAGAMLAAVLMALPLGVVGALRRDRAGDQGARLLSVLALSTPAFVSGPLAIFAFSVWLPWAPTPAHDATPLAALVLPSLVVGFALSGRLSRLLRAALLEALASDYVLALRARGLPERRILWRHALLNASLPVLTVLGMQLAALLGGALVTEKVFGRPGLGTLLLDGIAARDHAVVQGCVLLIGAAYLVTNTAVEVVARWLDPRLKPGVEAPP